MSSAIGDNDPYRSDSVKNLDNSFYRASRERGGGLTSQGEYTSMGGGAGSAYPESYSIAEKDFNLYE